MRKTPIINPIRSAGRTSILQDRDLTSILLRCLQCRIRTEKKLSRHILALRIDHRLIRHMDLGSRTRSRKTAQLFRTDRMELGLSLHLFHKLKHTLIPIVRPIPLAVLTDETGTDKNMYHNSPSFIDQLAQTANPALSRSLDHLPMQAICSKKAGPPHKSTCGSDPAFSFYFQRSRCVFAIPSSLVSQFVPDQITSGSSC